MDPGSYTARLNGVTVSDSRELDRVCEEVALALHRDGTEPPFDVRSSDFAADPYLICSDRYWRLRFLEQPSIRTAAACSLWISAHVSREARVEVLEKWALGYAFITKDSVESAVELSQSIEEIVSRDTPAGDVAYFSTLYHAGKLRSDFLFEELHRFLDASLLALAVGTHRQSALFTALRSFAAFGSPAVTAEHAVSLLDQAWNSADRTRHVVDICLNGIQFAASFEGHGELLRDRAAEAVRDHPGDHMFHFRLATGHHMTGDHDAALTSIDTALRLLPAVGTRGSHKLLQEQYLTKREVIVEGRQRAALDAEHQQRLADQEERHQERWARSEEEIRRRDERLNRALKDNEESARANHVRSVELVALFSSVIAFAVGSLQVTLTGDFPLRDRLLLIGAWGSAHALFALLVIGGTWLITRPRRT
ncbi:hypothetical protein A3Q37_02772 [Streptomyces sp. PTY087I2]|nr:hypothetical protein A3Q37_02772 [Streptomyces sp. PTY087I2]